MEVTSRLSSINRLVATSSSGRVRSAAAALGMRCSKPGSKLDGGGFSGNGFLAMPGDHLRREGAG